MLSCFTRVHLYLYQGGFVTEGTVVLREKYDAKLPKLYQIRGEQTFSILEELEELKFKKKRIFSSSVIRYSLLLRYTSLQTYRLLMKEFPFPSLSLLKKITEGQLDAVKCAKSLKLRKR